MRNLKEIKDLLIIKGLSSKISKTYIVVYKSKRDGKNCTRIDSASNNLKVAIRNCNKTSKLMGWDCEVVINN